MKEHRRTEATNPTDSVSANRTHLAIWSIVAGLAGLILYLVPLIGVPAIVMGSKAWNRLDSNSPYRWAAGTGIALGVLATLAWLGSLFPES